MNLAGAGMTTFYDAITFVVSSILIANLLLAQEMPRTTTGTKTETTAGSVTRALFTSRISDREPQDEITSLSSDMNKIYFFTELKGMSGQTITHRWEFNGQVMAEIPFNIGAPRWRVWSNKTLDPNWLGEWKVSVVDSEGKVISEKAFTRSKAGQ